MEQIAQKRSSKEKGSDKVKSPEDEPSITEVARSVTELQSQMEAVNSRLDAQELAQREFSVRLAHVEDNISAIKINVESISSARKGNESGSQRSVQPHTVFEPQRKH